MGSDALNLDARTVIVSGAGGGGIGTSIMRLVAEAGATVIAVDRSSESLDKQADPLIARELKIVKVVADVLTPEGVAAVMDSARVADAELYGLVTVVGGVPPTAWARATHCSREDWDALISLNLGSMIHLTQAVAADLTSRSLPGSIVAISSISGSGASTFHAGYGAAKAAVDSVVRTMAVELAESGVRINAVAPGTISSPVSQGTDQNPERDKRGVPMGRRGVPDEIAGPVLFLLSDLASYITGQCIAVDGGISLKWSHLGDNNAPLFLTNQSVIKGL